MLPIERGNMAVWDAGRRKRQSKREEKRNGVMCEGEEERARTDRKVGF